MWGSIDLAVRIGRTLLKGEEEYDATAAYEGAAAEGESTVTLRIAAIFLILAAGLAGGVPPLVLQPFQSPSHCLPRLLRALCAGIILALALIHIIPEAVLEMDALGELMGDYPYNAAGACVSFGVLVMVDLDALAQAFMIRQQRETQVAACMFEFGCIFHSIVIGIALGVNTEAVHTVRSLLIALCFHQFLEGVALGSFITQARLSKWKGVCMVVLYALTCPIGVAIGIGITDSYDAESFMAVTIQGVFNGISGGMLLYIALVQLIAEDFSRRELPDTAPPQHDSLPPSPSPPSEAMQQESASISSAPPGWQVWASHGFLWLGAAAMALLAIWA